MKKTFLIILTLSLSLVLAAALMAGQKVTVTAKITKGDLGAGSKGTWMAHNEPAKIVIPPGKQAVNFSAQNGSNFENKGWSIKRDQDGRQTDVYAFQMAPTNWNATFQKFMDRAPKETPVPLKNLTLGPGTYFVYVSGSPGAFLNLTFTLNP